MRRELFFSVVFMVLLGTVVEAQQRQTRPASTPKSDSSWTRSRTTTSRSTSNVAPSVSRAPAPAASRSAASNPTPGGWGTDRSNYNPIDPYAQISSRLKNIPGYRYQPWDLYYCDLFYSRLMMEFGYGSGRDAFWTFAQGYPALTPQAADLALRTSTQAADQILSSTSHLSGLLDQYEAGEISRPALEQASKDLLSEIRRQTKAVRSDFYVSYLDQRQALEAEKFGAAASITGLRELISELRSRALNLRTDFDQYFREDRTRVISVEDLAQPSFKSRSKEIDNLAAAIKKSVVKL